MVMFLEAAGLVTREILPVNEGQSTDRQSRGLKMIITAIETFPPRIPSRLVANPMLPPINSLLPWSDPTFASEWRNQKLVSF